ncbi:MAG: SsrA-binding protein SmpB [candidate division Zixibacteria bacterium]|nr:SsrA-binding protein SmpB [candidate division Zixibacteria bacterium]
MVESTEKKYIVRNKKARHDYEIKDTYEAGISLKGSEVKSLREGKINISDAYALVENGEVVLKNLHISPYKMAQDTLDPIRPRRLLLNKREIRKIKSLTEQKGLTLIPLSLYFSRNLVKIELGVAVGRKKYDKRNAIAKADADRKMKQATKRDY